MLEEEYEPLSLSDIKEGKRDMFADTGRAVRSTGGLFGVAASSGGLGVDSADVLGKRQCDK
eukprot:9170659-Ditylum_brightwellii.AAC.1